MGLLDDLLGQVMGGGGQSGPFGGRQQGPFGGGQSGPFGGGAPDPRGGGGLGSVLGAVLGGGGQPMPGARSSGGGMASILMALLPIVLQMLSSGRGGPAANVGMGGYGAQQGGGIGDVLGQILGGASGGQGGGLGGLGGLLGQLQNSGYADQAQSWVGRGQNAPISADDIGAIFGQGGLSNIAKMSGLSEQDAAAGLAHLLPEVVDHVTPEGNVPDPQNLTANIEALARRFGLG